MIVIRATFRNILGISETWFTSTEVALAGHRLVRSDRPENMQGGDIVIYIKDTLLVSLAPILPVSEDIDAVSVLVCTNHHKTMMCCVY